MRNTLVLLKRELNGYFATPVAYVFIFFYLVAMSLLPFYLGGFYEREQADLQPFFAFHPWLYLFLIPAIEPLQTLRYAYGPALIAVGVLMVGSVRQIDFDDLTELVPALVTVGMMLFTYNIANGLTAGLVLYPVLKAASGRARELSLGSVVLAVLCLVYFLFGLPH